MPLIFLDTPQLNRLERVREGEIARYRSFLQLWNDLGCTLVFTGTQLSELRRYRDARRREGRYELLQELTPVRTDFALSTPDHGGPRTLLERELFRAILRRRLGDASGPGADEIVARWTDIFPGHFATTAEIEPLRLFEDEIFLSLYSLEYDAAAFSAAAEHREPGSRLTQPRLKDVPDEPLSEEQVKDYLAEAEAALAAMKEESAIGNLPPLDDSIVDQIRENIQLTVSRMAEVGPRAMLLGRLAVNGTEPTMRRGLRARVDDLATRYSFEWQVQRFVYDVLGKGPEEAEFLTRVLSLEDCPGSWLRSRIDLVTRRSRHALRPSHRYDLDRLAYLPYVDRLFTDAEMSELSRQALRDPVVPEAVRAVRAPVAILDSIEALETALTSISP